MSNDLVIIDNLVVGSAYKLSLNELRLIYCALAQMPRGEPVDCKRIYNITREDFISAGGSSAHVARDIRQAVNELIKRSIKIQTLNGEMEFNWLHSAFKYDNKARQKLEAQFNRDDLYEYLSMLKGYNLDDKYLPTNDDNIVASIRFHEDIIPLLSDLTINFTKIFIKDIKQFKSIYSHRIYQLMMQFSSTGFVIISLDELRTMLLLKNKYPKAKDLRKRVIDVAMAEINETSPYSVEYELIKQGRAFKNLKLKFKKKNPSRCDKTSDMFDNEIIETMTPKQAQYFASLLANDDGFGASYANIGESMKAFEKRLQDELLQDKFIKKYKKHLERVGYAPRQQR